MFHLHLGNDDEHVLVPVPSWGQGIKAYHEIEATANSIDLGASAAFSLVWHSVRLLAQCHHSCNKHPSFSFSLPLSRRELRQALTGKFRSFIRPFIARL